MYLAENLTFLRKYLQLTQGEVAETVGLSRTSLIAYEKGESMPSVDMASKLSTLYKVSLDALLHRTIYKFSDLQLQKFFTTPDPVLSGQILQVREVVRSVGNDNEENIELVPLKATMGYVNGGYQNEEFIANLSTFRLPLPGISKERKYRLFPAEGESMLPIPADSYVLGEYVEDWYTVKDGTGCIVVSNDGIVVKKVVNELATHNRLMLHSLNSAYKPYEIQASNIIELWKFKLYMSLDFPDQEPSLSTILSEVRKVRELVSPHAAN